MVKAVDGVNLNNDKGEIVRLARESGSVKRIILSLKRVLTT